MSLEEKVGQVFQIRFTADYPSPNSPELLALRDQIRRYHIGSLTLGARMSGPNLVKSSPERVAEIINALQEDAAVPLLIGADIERGLVSRVSDVPEFPFLMAFGAVGSTADAERFGRITAEEARSIGITWAYAPVADVNSNPRNPIINTRSFGDDPAKVSSLVAAYIRGAHSAGERGSDKYLLVSAKHFPGEGDTATDPHAHATAIQADRAHLDHVELAPFRDAFRAGADSVMLAQAAVPAVDPDAGHVAATSEKVVTGLLRNELHFDGLVLTDALEMRGVTTLYAGDGNPSGRIAVEAFKAGADVLMLPRDLDAAYRAMLDAVKSGEISQERLDRSVRRILAAKASVGLDKRKTVDLAQVHAAFADPAPQQFAQQISDAAVTLVRSSGHLLPISSAARGAAPAGQTPQKGVPQKKVVFVTFTDSARSKLGKTFDQEVAKREDDARVLHFYNDLIGSDSNEAILAFVKDADVVVVGAFLTHIAPRQVAGGDKLFSAVGFAGPGAKLFSDLMDVAKEKTVVVALGSPYLIEEFPDIRNYICTYSLARTAEVSAAKALFGELSNTATLPIDLPGVAQRGSSLTWPVRVTAK